MEQKSSNKQVLLSVIGIAILVVAVVGVSFAFFNYTRTGSANTLTTGHIDFTTTQTTIALTNFFPVTATSGGIAADDLQYTAESIVKISGNTTYAGGVDYRVSAVAVHTTVATGVSLPISVRVSTNAFPNDVPAPTTYNYARLQEGNLLAAGNIPYDKTATNAEIHVRAYIDANQVAITDTYNGTATPTDDYGTTQSWVNGRTVLTTQQWNSLNLNGAASVSFKILVEAKQGGTGAFQQITATTGATVS